LRSRPQFGRQVLGDDGQRGRALRGGCHRDSSPRTASMHSASPPALYSGRGLGRALLRATSSQTMVPRGWPRSRMALATARRAARSADWSAGTPLLGVPSVGTITTSWNLCEARLILAGGSRFAFGRHPPGGARPVFHLLVRPGRREGGPAQAVTSRRWRPT